MHDEKRIFIMPDKIYKTIAEIESVLLSIIPRKNGKSG